VDVFDFLHNKITMVTGGRRINLIDTFESISDMSISYYKNTDAIVIDISKRLYLKSLSLTGYNIHEIISVGNLHTLELYGCHLTKCLPNLGNLKVLNITKTNITDVSMCSNLETLFANSTKVIDVSMLGNLRELLIAHTDISDVSMLSKVNYLNISYTNVTDVSMLCNLKILVKRGMNNLDVSMLNNTHIYR
jgi:hypothetical protein